MCEAVTRYRVKSVNLSPAHATFEQHADGEWVKYEDVLAHLRAVEAAHQQEMEQAHTQMAAMLNRAEVAELQLSSLVHRLGELGNGLQRADAAEARRPALDAAPPRDDHAV